MALSWMWHFVPGLLGCISEFCDDVGKQALVNCGRLHGARATYETETSNDIRCLQNTISFRQQLLRIIVYSGPLDSARLRHHASQKIQVL